LEFVNFQETMLLKLVCIVLLLEVGFAQVQKKDPSKYNTILQFFRDVSGQCSLLGIFVCVYQFSNERTYFFT